MLAMALKELRQLARDRRTVAMMVVLPLVLLVVFGYAARFDVDKVSTIVAGQGPSGLRLNGLPGSLPGQLDVIATHPDWGRDEAVDALRRGEASVVVLAGPRQPTVLIDGVNLF